MFYIVEVKVNSLTQVKTPGDEYVFLRFKFWQQKIATSESYAPLKDINNFWTRFDNYTNIPFALCLHTNISAYCNNGIFPKWIKNSVNSSNSSNHKKITEAWVRVNLKIPSVSFNSVVEWLRCLPTIREVSRSNTFFITDFNENHLGKSQLLWSYHSIVSTWNVSYCVDRILDIAVCKWTLWLTSDV